MKKLIALVLVLMVVVSTSAMAFANGTKVDNKLEEPSVSWEELVNGSVIIGDLNGDRKVTAYDARVALKMANGEEEITNKALVTADFNKDKKITAYDARQILVLAAGK